MVCECERCHQTKECTFAGAPADVDGEKAQNGEWLCQDCVPSRLSELDAAIAKFKGIFGE